MDSEKGLKQKLYSLQNNKYFFWFSLVILNSLFLLPEVLFHPAQNQLIPLPPLHAPRGWYDFVVFFFRRENIDFFRLVVDFYFLLTVLWLTRKTRYFQLIRRIAIVVYLFLLLFHAYDTIMLFTFGHHPILYNDLKLALGAFYLLVDISFSRLFLGILVIIIPSIITLTLIPFFFNTLALRIEKMNLKRATLIAGIALWAMILGFAFWFTFQYQKSCFRWVTPKIVQNIKESYRVHQSLEVLKTAPIDSAYYSYQNIPLVQKPNIYLFLLESYGKVLAERPELRPAYFEMMKKFENELHSTGWFTATNYSASPISGGISWLSIATTLNGMKIKDQALYSLLLSRVRNLPGLVQFLKSQHYHTFNLQPMNRPRAGYSFSEYDAFFPFDTQVYFDKLHFQASPFGYGFIPDQYSLFFTHQNYLRSALQPYFLFFMTTSSHYPWTNVPRYISHWDSLNPGTGEARNSHNLISNVEGTYYVRFMSKKHLENYLKAMEYEIKFSLKYIEQLAPPNSIFIILGDHQPPFITNEQSSFQTPIHIISRDSLLTGSLQEYGFQPGLTKSSEAGNTIRHESIYSLLVRTLASRYSELPREKLPEFKPRGVPLSTIRNHILNKSHEKKANH